MLKKKCASLPRDLKPRSASDIVARRTVFERLRSSSASVAPACECVRV